MTSPGAWQLSLTRIFRRFERGLLYCILCSTTSHLRVSATHRPATSSRSGWAKQEPGPLRDPGSHSGGGGSLMLRPNLFWCSRSGILRDGPLLMIRFEKALLREHDCVQIIMLTSGCRSIRVPGSFLSANYGLWKHDLEFMGTEGESKMFWACRYWP